jgi:SAM-dependent methyltransferase
MDAVERLSPEEAGRDDLLALTHVHRYRVAGELCDGRRVLDLCCGSGYGSRILAERATAVHGVDIHLPSIEAAAAEAAGDEGLTFECADALEVLERDLGEDFDAIVLFEGLEHLPDLDRAVLALRRHVDAGLGVLVSLPNSRTFGEENRFHHTEFDYEEAVETFKRIGATDVLHQFHAEGSLISSREDGPLDGSSGLSGRAEPEHCNHMIAFANLDFADDRASAHMRLTAAPSLNTYMLDLERTNRRLWRTNLRLGRERMGIADSAAAAALERLRVADEAAERERERLPSPPSRLSSTPLGRFWASFKRSVALVMPHGLVVAKVQRDERRAGPANGDEAPE